jgi:hypothetical protein
MKAKLKRADGAERVVERKTAERRTSGGGACCGARLRCPPMGVSPWVWMLLLVVLSFLPDVDVMAFRLRIPCGAPFGPQGAFHSLAFAGVWERRSADGSNWRPWMDVTLTRAR